MKEKENFYYVYETIKKKDYQIDAAILNKVQEIISQYIIERRIQWKELKE